MTVKCVSIGSFEMHAVNCLLYLSVLIYVCHPSSWNFYWKLFKFWSLSFSFLRLGFSRDLRKHFFNTYSLSVIFSWRHQTIEVASLTPMHCLFLSAGGSSPIAWLCWVSTPVLSALHSGLHLQGVCWLFGMCHGTRGWPNNFLEEGGDPWSHQKGLSTNDAMQAPW